MYWHSRELKYVQYDKVNPCPIEKADEDFIKAYKWLGEYCLFCPQIWLSVGKKDITGYTQYMYSSRKKKSLNKLEDVLFGFDIIKGFPVEYNNWCFLLSSLINDEKPNDIMERLDKWAREEPEDFEDDPTYQGWIRSGRNIDIFLKDCLFVEKNQVVVPSLNLKVAKKVICRDDKVKKKLRHMGFIEDRIEVRKMT